MLVDMGLVDEETILTLLARQSGMEVVDLDGMEVSEDAIGKVPATIARTYHVVPVRLESGTLTVAMANPLNADALDDLRFMLDCKVVGAVARKTAVLKAIEHNYGSQT